MPLLLQYHQLSGSFLPSELVKTHHLQLPPPSPHSMLQLHSTQPPFSPSLPFPFVPSPPAPAALSSASAPLPSPAPFSSFPPRPASIKRQAHPSPFSAWPPALPSGAVSLLRFHGFSGRGRPGVEGHHLHLFLCQLSSMQRQVCYWLLV